MEIRIPFSSKIKYSLILCIMLFMFNSCVTPLQTAVYSDNAESVKKLTKKRKHLDARRGIHAAPLQIAVSRNNLEITKILIDAGAKVSGDLFFVVNDTAICKLLVEKGANYQITDKDGNTPIHTISNPEVIRYLLGKGMKADPVSRLGDTPLLLAVHNQGYEKAKILLENGADPDYLSPYGNSPKIAAAKLKDQKMTDILNKK